MLRPKEIVPNSPRAPIIHLISLSTAPGGNCTKLAVGGGPTRGKLGTIAGASVDTPYLLLTITQQLNTALRNYCTKLAAGRGPTRGKLGTMARASVHTPCLLLIMILTRSHSVLRPKEIVPNSPRVPIIHSISLSTAPTKLAVGGGPTRGKLGAIARASVDIPYLLLTITQYHLILRPETIVPNLPRVGALPAASSAQLPGRR